MGPTKTSRMVNKRTCKASGDWPGNVVENASKSKVKKRKLSDMLDYRWNKEELKQFYAAFRKYGKNWRKVAELIGNRSIVMVESLYNLNRAYLNLSEGMATADGFIAMMTDHYNNLDGSDNDYERKDATEKILKPVKSSRGKCGLEILKRSDGRCLQNQSAKSSYWCKQKKYLEAFFVDCWPRAVQKRTPRVPVGHNHGSHGGDSSLISGFSQRSKLVGNVKRMYAETETANSSDISLKPDENCLEGYSGRRDVDNGLLGKDTTMQDTDCVDHSATQCSALDPLRILADVSLNIGLQASADESESLLHGVKQKGGNGPVKGFQKIVNSRISSNGDKEYSSTVFHNSAESETVLANPESYKPEIFTKGDLEYPSSVTYDEILLKEAKLQQLITPDKITAERTVSDAEAAKGPTINIRPQSFAENRQIAEIESYQDCCVDKCAKKEENEPRNPAKLDTLPTDLHDNIVLGQSLDADGTSLSPAFKIERIISTKQGENADVTLKATASVDEVDTSQHKTSSQSCLLMKVQSMESDIITIADLTRALDKKEKVLKELRQMNDVVSGRTIGILAADPTHVIEQYSEIVKLLNEVNNEVASASYNLRQRNNYNKNSTPPLSSSLKDSAEYYGLPDLSAEYLSSQDSSSHIVEIVTNAKRKARTMVDAAVLTMSFLKEREDAYIRIRDASDSAVNEQYRVDSHILGTMYSCSTSSAYRNQALLFSSKQGAFLSSANESEILSGLISDCIATVFINQNTSQRQYPPADIVRILEQAVESLQPRCSQNLPVFREIEKCMGYIKTQMLTLVDTPNTISV